MAAGVYKLLVDKGSRKTLKLTRRNPSTTPGVKGDPKDLTGYGCRGQVKTKANDETALMSFDCLIPGQSIIENLGIIYVDILPSKTSAIPTKGKNYAEKTTLYYDIELFSLVDEEDVIRILNGDFVLSPEQTTSLT